MVDRASGTRITTSNIERYIGDIINFGAHFGSGVDIKVCIITSVSAAEVSGHISEGIISCWINVGSA